MIGLRYAHPTSGIFHSLRVGLHRHSLRITFRTAVSPSIDANRPSPSRSAGPTILNSAVEPRRTRRTRSCSMLSLIIQSPAGCARWPRQGLGHNPGHRASREVDGPHSGPYGSRHDRRVRCADRTTLAEFMIKAGCCCFSIGGGFSQPLRRLSVQAHLPIKGQLRVDSGRKVRGVSNSGYRHGTVTRRFVLCFNMIATDYTRYLQRESASGRWSRRQ